MKYVLTILAAALVLAGPAAAPAGAAPGAGVDQLLAPVSVCPHQNQLTAPNRLQVQVMRCLTNYARTHSKLDRLNPSGLLFQAGAAKARDMLRCDEFSHEACGRKFTYWMENVGYLQGSCWGAAENIAWGVGATGTPHAIFRAWLNSSGHRENILGAYTDIGIGLRIGAIEGKSRAHVWVQEFGSHSC